MSGSELITVAVQTYKIEGRDAAVLKLQQSFLLQRVEALVS